ncbi:DUF2190 family protein [Geopsychrobacter electrodiphilus]|uniref:DUF2190 family protein n=1 Tax=Geopsychrobacter electrodiphilus TaxID=225196 RepID=UPI00037B2EA7|nr:DUF2190 family protein [Geopsychrobacter electrodiphilus]
MANEIATIRASLSMLLTLILAHTAAVLDGEIIVSAGQVLVAGNAADANAETSYVFRGPVEFPKVAAQAQPAGTVVYWDATAGNITTTATANTRAGIVREAALAADTTVLVELHEN